MKNQKKITNKEVLKKLNIHLAKLGYDCYLTDDLEFLDILWLANVTVGRTKNEIGVSFEVSARVDMVAILLRHILKVADKYKIKVIVFSPYMLILSEEGEYVDTLFDEEAIEYYYQGIEPKSWEGKEKVKPEQTVDKQKRIDSILDQISQKGMNSLTEEQKEFLKKHSKNK